MMRLQPRLFTRGWGPALVAGLRIEVLVSQPQPIEKLEEPPLDEQFTRRSEQFLDGFGSD